jgi:hypothetical protein
MRVVLFGATGMVGQGVLRECLLDPDVESVVSIGRGLTRQQHPKLRELQHNDFLDFPALEDQLWGFFGRHHRGAIRAHHLRVTLAVARVLVRLNPGMTFI